MNPAETQPSSIRLTPRSITRVDGDACSDVEDWVAVEEPLEIRLAYHSQGLPVQKSLSITMRTPGHDAELAVGFLLSEGLIADARSIVRVGPCGPESGELQLRNVVKVELAADLCVDVARLERHFYTSSSCGVCGKSSLEAVSTANCRAIPDGFEPVSADVIYSLPDRLRAAQEVFDRTGGLHASAYFDRDGTLLALREDVGRHNALDKLIGAHLLEDRLPLSAGLVLLSGRASFELVQKALVAGIPVLAAVGAPSSLAVDLARRFNLTLLGFVRGGRCNVYSGAQRLRLPC